MESERKKILKKGYCTCCFHSHCNLRVANKEEEKIEETIKFSQRKIFKVQHIEKWRQLPKLRRRKEGKS